MAKAILLGAALELVPILAMILAAHVARTRSIFRAGQLGFLATLAAVVPLYLATPADLGFLPERFARTPRALGAASAFLLCVLFWFNEAQVFFYVTRSITLRMLVEFAKSENGVLDVPHLRATYGLDSMIHGRFEALERNGWMRTEGGRRVLAPKARLAVACLRGWRRVLGLDFYLELE
ncbi:MAG TPA: hypothetical protein VFF73_32970 [Planctomycetota bacterium]|nr:hypothetical protein [Planctomycetota bacterium]